MFASVIKSNVPNIPIDTKRIEDYGEYEEYLKIHSSLPNVWIVLHTVDISRESISWLLDNIKDSNNNGGTYSYGKVAIGIFRIKDLKTGLKDQAYVGNFIDACLDMED